MNLFRNFFTQKESFSGHVAALMTGTAFAFVINLAALPFLSRLYSPESFGLLAIFGGIVTVIAVFAAGRYELAIVLPDRDEEAQALMKLYFIIVEAVTAISLVVILSIGKHLFHFFNLSQMDPWLDLLPLGIILTSLYSIFFYWSSRRKAFRLVAVARLSQTVFMVLFQLVAAFIWPGGAAGLILGYLVGQIPGIAILFHWRGKTSGMSLNPSSVREVASRYRDFPRFSSTGALLETVALQLPVIAISAIFNPYAGGLFAVADRLLRSVPVGLIGNPVSQVFFRRLTEIRMQPEKRKWTILRVWKYLLLLTVIPSVCVIFFGPDLFAFALGTEWQKAGEFASILTIGFAAQFIALPSGMGLIALEQLKILLGWQILNFLSLILVLMVGFLYLRNDITTFLWILTCKEVAMQSLCMAALLWANRSYVPKTETDIVGSTAR